MTVPTALDLFNDGRLTEAVEAASAVIRSRPTDTSARFILAQLLCFQDEYERADRQFETFATQASQPVPGVSLCRQLIRAAKCRQEFFTSGRLPEFFTSPEPEIEHLLRAWVELRAGDVEASVEQLRLSQQAGSPCPGQHGERSFSAFLELDDYLAPVIEVLTPTGKYFWVPISQIRRMAFRPAEKPLDLLWRPATLDVIHGPSGDAYVPVVYCRPAEVLTDGFRVGRETDWIEVAEGVCRGIGQRCYLVDEECLGIMELDSVEFAHG